MNRTRTIRLISAAFVVAIVFAVVIGLSGADSLSAGQTSVTRSPRPHPSSHLAETPGSIVVDGVLRSPRPHPTSHLEVLTHRPR